MQDLFNEQLKTLKEALLYHLRSISDVDTLLSIEVRFLSLFSRFLDLCVDVRRRYERPAAPLQRGIDLRDAKLPRGAVGGHHQGQRDDVGFNARIHGRDVGDAVENERFERYTIHSAEDFFGPISKYHLLDETPTVGARKARKSQSFPYVCEFTGTVPTVLQTISNAMSRFGRITSSLGVTDSYTPRHQVRVRWNSERSW